MTEQLNVPLSDTTAPQPVTVALALTELETVRPGVNPAPAIVVWAPLGPWAGVRVIVGVVIR